MELHSSSCSAEDQKSENLPKIAESPPQFIYCTAEKAIDKDYLERLKDNMGKLHKSIAAVVIDETHTVETWTEKRYKFVDLNEISLYCLGFPEQYTLRTVPYFIFHFTGKQYKHKF